MTQRILLIAFLLCGSTLAPAQPGQDDTLSIQFDCLAWGDANTQGIKYIQDGQAVPLRISRAFRTGPYRYTGPSPIVFFREARNEDGTLKRVPVATVEVSPSQKQVLMLFTHSSQGQGNPDDPEPLQVMALGDGLEEFPPGSYRVFNLSEHTIGCVLADETFMVEPKQFTTITPAVHDNLDVRIHFSSKVDGQWVPSINTRWLYRQNARRLVFVARDNRTDRPLLKVKTISQFLKDE